MTQPPKMISDALWARLKEAAQEIVAAQTETEKQSALRAMAAIMQRELEIDFGAAW